MTPKKRFLVGGGGALMPVLISILAIDVGATLGSDLTLSTANIVGIFIRYLILFIIGGVVAYLHEDESSSFKLFELGIAAPALLTSLISAQGIFTEPNPDKSASFFDNISIISSAYADETTYADETRGERRPEEKNFLADVFSGFSGQAYRKLNLQTKKPTQTRNGGFNKPDGSVAEGLKKNN